MERTPQAQFYITLKYNSNSRYTVRHNQVHNSYTIVATLYKCTRVYKHNKIMSIENLKFTKSTYGFTLYARAWMTESWQLQDFSQKYLPARRKHKDADARHFIERRRHLRNRVTRNGPTESEHPVHLSLHRVVPTAKHVLPVITISKLSRDYPGSQLVVALANQRVYAILHLLIS